MYPLFQAGKSLSSKVFYFRDECGEGGVVQRSLQREKDSGDSGK